MDPAEAMITMEDEEQASTFKVWEAMGKNLEESSAKVAYVFKHMMPYNSKTELDLSRALFRVLEAGNMPRIHESVAYHGCLDIWSKKMVVGTEKLLGDATTLHLRYQDADAVLMGPARSIWPPPITLVVNGDQVAESASCCWEFTLDRKVPKDFLKEACKDVERTKGWKGVTIFRKGIFRSDVPLENTSSDSNFVAVNGRPTDTFFLKALGVPEEQRKDLEDFGWKANEDPIKFTAKWAPQCAFCLERPAGGVSHTHTQCPLIGTLNKIRAQASIKPLSFNQGVLVRLDDKVDLDLPKEVRTLLDKVSSLLERMDKLEKAASTSGGPSNPGGGKKRKQDQGGNDGPAQKKGKQGGEGSGQGGGQKAGQGQGKGKGKGKDKE
jgi:hypothetical protein